MKEKTILNLVGNEQNSDGVNAGVGHKVFSTIGELHKTDLSCLVLDLGLLHDIETTINGIDRKAKIHYYGAGRFNGCYSIICVLQSRKNKSLKEGKQSAYIYNCDKPELSGVEELVVKKNWLGQFTWEDI